MDRILIAGIPLGGGICLEFYACDGEIFIGVERLELKKKNNEQILTLKLGCYEIAKILSDKMNMLTYPLALRVCWKAVIGSKREEYKKKIFNVSYNENQVGYNLKSCD